MAALTSYPAGDQIPITRTFIQGTTTTAIPLIGQVLNDGKTNWIGVDEGSAYYIFPSSEAGAEQTSLDNGMTYYYSEGKAPAGYLATGASGGGNGGSGSAAGITTSMPVETGSAGSMGSTMNVESSGSAAETMTTMTTSGIANGRAAVGGLASFVLGLFAWLL